MKASNTSLFLTTSLVHFLLGTNAFQSSVSFSRTAPTTPFLTWRSSFLNAAGKDDRDSSLQHPNNNRDIIPKANFAMGEELRRLRADLDSLRENLQWAEAMDDHARVDDLAAAVKKGEERDPDIMYSRALRRIAEIKANSHNKNGAVSEADKQAEIKRWQHLADAAKAVMPKFQLDGLWVGNYGEHGLQLINVTYTGDTMVATKVTGDVTVPRGQVSFTVDLASHNSSAALEPLKLSLDATQATVPRFAGQGQIAKEHFADPKFVAGQMVLFARHFSFVWVPTRHHVLFRRPTPEQVITLLRDTYSKEDEMENMRSHLVRCWDMDMTESLARHHAHLGQEPFRRISTTSDLKAQQRGEGKKNRKKDSPTVFNFWHVHKWRQYIDGVLNNEDPKKELP